MNERIALYSSSLYSVASESGCTKEVYESLKTVSDLIEKNREYITIMSSAALSWEQRETLICEAFEGRVHIFALNFMKLIAKKRIFEIFIPVVKEYEKQYLKDNNITYATIVTAIELNEEKKSSIVEKIASSTGKEIIPTFVVKPDIVGGIIIETENSSIDASVAGQLQSIKRYISKN